MRRPLFALLVALLITAAIGCQKTQKTATPLDIRPLGENDAFAVLEALLAERNYQWDRDVPVGITANQEFACDYRVRGHKIAVEFLSEQDRIQIGSIPAPAAGSRLHVIQAYALGEATPSGGSASAASKPRQAREPIYILFIDDRNFTYHFNRS